MARAAGEAPQPCCYLGEPDCEGYSNIALFSELSVDFFKKYSTSSKDMDHIRYVKHEAVFATQMEAHTVASCTQ